MKKFLSILFSVLILTGVYCLITMLFGNDCDQCGDKIFGTTYRIENTGKEICERCAQYYK